MKNITFIISLLLLSTGCAEKKYFKEVVSTKKVTLSMHEYMSEKYLTLNIPVEFELDLNHPEIKYAIIYLKLDDKQLTDVEDYLVINSKNNKIVFDFGNIEYPNYPESIYIMQRKNRISTEDALALLKKYNPTATLESIKSRKDTIPLVSYAQYRKDNPQFLKEMRKQSDTLTLSIAFGGGKRELFKEKVNW